MAIVVSNLIKKDRTAWPNKPDTEEQKQEDLELSQKIAPHNFEKKLQTTEKAEHEDSIAYLARCMREAEQEGKQ